MTDEPRLREVERRVSVHEAECSMRQRQILESIQALRDDGVRRDAKLGSIQKGVWSAFAVLTGLGLGSAWPGWFAALRHLAGS